MEVKLTLLFYYIIFLKIKNWEQNSSAKDIEELIAAFPKKKPQYYNINLNPYEYIKNSDDLNNHYHFAPELVKNTFSALNDLAKPYLLDPGGHV